MSFSLSSLLNPADEPDAKEESTTEQRRESQASAQALVASPEQQHVSLPKYTSPPPRQAPSEQVTALSAFAASSAPPPTEWNGYTAHDAQRELPPLPTMSSGDRKMSSPTLDQYHVASRSPEQHRAPLSSVQSAAFALPPLKHVISPPEAAAETSLADADETVTSSVKKEAVTPQPTSPTDARPSSVHMTDMESKAVASLKTEHSARYQSPLRESSTPMPSTEISAPDSVVPKKRPAPKKKGTATAKKAPPAKRRKVELARSDTPSSRVSKSNFVTGSSKGTPANSSPAPSARSRSAGVEDDDDDDEEEGSPVGDDMYCICRRPDTGTFMIGCDGTCDDWFHGKCVGIEERDKNLIDKYMCPNCTSGGVGKTTWKRMCRRSGCRQAARVGKNKSGGSGSKYCSDDCGVLFFREMTANARGREQTAKSRAGRRAKVDDAETVIDPGARGGLLAPGEVRALLDTSKTLDDFKKLGEGVLSPPATPGDKGDDGGTDTGSGTTLNEQETSELAGITGKKEAARDRHSLLKDRLKFVSLVKQAASRAMAEKELKATKDYCGFDPRLEWSEEQFAVWRRSAAGKRAYEMDLLDVEATEADEEAMLMLERAEIEADTVFGGAEPCERKKCARHAEWAKLATDDVRFEMTDNGDKMRVLERGEHAVRERAALRARSGAQDAAEDDDAATRMDVNIPASAAMDAPKSAGPGIATLDGAAEDAAMTNGTDHPEAAPPPLTPPKLEPVITTNGTAEISPEHMPQVSLEPTETPALEGNPLANTAVPEQATDVAIST
ncbi:COMPASS (complex proteins associated with Set1p) component [Oleoguttula sp. CCFEE 5521]